MDDRRQRLAKKAARLAVKLCNGDYLDIDGVYREVCEGMQVKKSEVCTSSRTQCVVMARHAIRYLLYERLDRSYQETAALTGSSDHTTAIHSVNIIRRAIGGLEQ